MRASDTPWLARLALRVFARIVRPGQRERWFREWSAELASWWTSRSVGSEAGVGAYGRLFYRVLLAALDAAHVRRLGASLEGSADERGGRGVRARGGGSMIQDLVQDARFAVRTMVRQPGFSAVAALTIGLGIAVTATIFSLVNGILLKPLPFPEPDRIVSVWPERWFSPAFFEFIQEQTESYETVAAWQWRAHVDARPEGSERLWGPMVSAEFFEVLGRIPVIGRGFATGEDRPGNEGVAVLSHGFWQRRFAGDPSVLGESIELRGVRRTIVGVMPADFDFLHAGTDVVLPIVVDPESVRYGDSSYKLLARLKDGVSREQADAELKALAARVRNDNDLPPEWGLDAAVIPLRDYLVGEIRPTLWLLFGAVGLLLLIATANVANLLLARALVRQREVSLRLALGAGSGRLIRQLLTESTLLGLVGAIPGVAGAILGLRAVIALLPADTPRLAQAQVNVSVLFFSVALALLTGWVVGLVPAIQGRRADLRAGLTSGGRGATGTGGRLRTGLVVAEVALAVTLLAGSGLLIKSFWRLNQVDPGFQPESLLTFEVLAAPGRLNSFTESEAYFSALSEGFSAIPGVEAVSRITRAPMAPDGNVIRVYAESRPPQSGDETLLGRWFRATPSYFPTAGIPLVRGRFLTESDAAGGDPVALISEEAAARLFPGEDPLGQRIMTGFEEFPVTVVGVVADLKTLGLDQEAPLIVYRPFAQTESVSVRFGVSSVRAFLIKTSVDPGSLAGVVRAAVQGQDPSALVEGIQSMDDAIAGSLADQRVILILLSAFALAAVLLGSIGIFGVVAYSVRQRTKEIGIRMALGASQGVVLRDVLKDGLTMGVVGITLGVGMALALSHIIERFVFEVSGSDPTVLAGAAALGLAVVLLASLGPARVAGRADPVRALAAE